MNWIDIASLVIILSFALVGLYRGFLRSVFRVVAWLVGIAGAYFSHLFGVTGTVSSETVSWLML